MSYAKYGYIFALPFIIIFLCFTLYPTVYTFVLAFTDAHGVGNEIKFLEEPFDNFRKILTNQTFRTCLKNTVKLWIMNFIPQITLAMVLTAWFTARRVTIKGQGFFKVLFYMPNIITAATIAILFNALFQYPKSPMNELIVSMGISDSYFNFFNSKSASQMIVAFIQFWIWYGNTMIVLISGVLGISPDIYEAADIDGANNVQIFFQITIPNLKTVLLYTLVTSLIGGLNVFDIPKLLNRGGPDMATSTASVFIYDKAFTGKQLFAQAACASIIMFVIISICSALLFYLMRDKEAIAMEKLKKADMKARRKGESVI
jgi:multiple sugar transport system permease protein